MTPRRPERFSVESQRECYAPLSAGAFQPSASRPIFWIFFSEKADGAKHSLPGNWLWLLAVGRDMAPARFNTQPSPGQLTRGSSPLNSSNLELSPVADFSMTVGSKPSYF